jgi:hypothetical protein
VVGEIAAGVDVVGANPGGNSGAGGLLKGVGKAGGTDAGG